MMSEDDQAGLVEIPFNVDSLGQAISHLREHNHSDSTQDQELNVHLSTLDQAVQFFQGTETSNSDVQRGIAQILQDINNTRVGYAYRAKAKLPGLSKQFLMARQAMVQRQDFSAHLTVLTAQPDSKDLLQQLQLEYSLFEDILEAGGDLDLDSLQVTTWKMFEGIMIMPEWEIETRLKLIEDLEKRVKGSEQLAAIQGRPGLIPLMLDTLSNARTDGQFALASSLEIPLTRLSLEGKIKLPESSLNHSERVAHFTKEGDVRGRFHEAISYLCQAAELNLEDTLKLGVSKLDLQKHQIELEAKIDALRAAHGIESIWGDIPLISGIRKRIKDKEFSHLLALSKKSNVLRNQIELADSINKIREYLRSSDIL